MRIIDLQARRRRLLSGRLDLNTRSCPLPPTPLNADLHDTASSDDSLDVHKVMAKHAQPSTIDQGLRALLAHDPAVRARTQARADRARTVLTQIDINQLRREAERLNAEAAAIERAAAEANGEEQS